MRNFLRIIFFLLCYQILPAQSPSGKSTVTRIIGEKKYYIHTIQKGQSLYAICKIYGTDQNTVLLENPDAIMGIRAGDELRIPFKPEETPASITPSEMDSILWHKVEKKETLYAISKKYNISEKQLLEMNPSLASGLKEGQQIRVGQKIKPSGQTISVSFKADTVYQWHVVKSGETLEQITAQYKTTLQQIKSLNNLSNILIKAGDSLRVREKVNQQTKKFIDAYEKQVGNSIRIIDSGHVVMRPKKPIYRVGLFLPITSCENDLPGLSDIITKKKSPPTTLALVSDFYEAYKMALDSLRSSDFQITTEVFDLNESDSNQVSKIVSSAEFKSLDMIIGPLHPGTFRSVAAAATQLGIPCISPNLTQNKILYENPSVSKLLPSKNHLLDCLARFAVDSFRLSNVVIVNTEKVKEQNAIRYFCNSYNTYLREKYNSLDTLHEVKGVSGLKMIYNDKTRNVAILLTESTVLLTDFFTQLSLFASDKKDITLLGSSAALSISSLDSRYLNRFHYTCSASYFRDEEQLWLKNVWNGYKNTYKSDPGDWFFQSYDLSFYFLSRLRQDGPDFWMNLQNSPSSGTMFSFNFFSPDSETGFDNRCGRILKVEDYRLTLIK